MTNSELLVKLSGIKELKAMQAEINLQLSALEDDIKADMDAKHHVFKNTLGNWLRTYTDSQLIGKTIQEVKL